MTETAETAETQPDGASEPVDPDVPATMRMFALTGGIGSGKSSVASRLAARGATIIDSDLVVRYLQQPGSPVLAKMAEKLGDSIIAADGSLDRAAVAGIVFKDKDRLADLNAVMGPAIRRELLRRTVEAAKAGELTVLDIPLFAEGPGYRKMTWSGVLVVDVPVDIAVARLMQYRNFTEDDARARIANQASRDERLGLADFVVDNGGDEAALDAVVEACWTWMAGRPEVPVPTSETFARH